MTFLLLYMGRTSLCSLVRCLLCVYLLCDFRCSVLVSVSVFMALSTVFRSLNSPDNSPLSHSVLLVLFLPYWSFRLYISL